MTPSALPFFERYLRQPAVRLRGAVVTLAAAFTRALLRDGDFDFRRTARDDDFRRAGLFGIVGLEVDFQGVAACGVAVVGRDRDPGGSSGAGLGNRGGPCAFGGEGHALGGLRVVGRDGLFQLPGVRDFDLPEIARMVVAFVAARREQRCGHKGHEEFCCFHLFVDFG